MQYLVSICILAHVALGRMSHFHCDMGDEYSAPALELGVNIWPIPREFCQFGKSICRLGRHSKLILDDSMSTEEKSLMMQHFESSVLDPDERFDSERLGDIPPCGETEWKLIIEEGPVDSDEYFHLSFDATQGGSGSVGELRTRSIEGGIRSFSFLQQLTLSNIVPAKYVVRDFPEVPYRGLLIDTGRHYLSLDSIGTILMGMCYARANYLHWHFSDDEAFPVDFSKSLAGEIPGSDSDRFAVCRPVGKRLAITQESVYSLFDITRVVDGGCFMGIRIFPEIDTPSHVELLTNQMPELTGIARSGLDPTSERPAEVAACMTAYVLEMFRLAAEKSPNCNQLNKGNININQKNIDAHSVSKHGLRLLHLGGDEVGDSWDTPEIERFMTKANIRSHGHLAASYYAKVFGYLQTKHNVSLDGLQAVFWEDMSTRPDFYEALTSLLPGLPIITQLWNAKLGDYAPRAGEKVVYSTEFYLDHLGLSWEDFLKSIRDVMKTISTDGSKKDSLLGVEACMWGERVDDSNIVQKVFPRLSVMAGIAWNPMHYQFDQNPSLQIAERLAAHRCWLMHVMRYPLDPIGSTQTEPVSDLVFPYVAKSSKVQWTCDVDFQEPILEAFKSSDFSQSDLIRKVEEPAIGLNA